MFEIRVSFIGGGGGIVSRHLSLNRAEKVS